MPAVVSLDEGSKVAVVLLDKKFKFMNKQAFKFQVSRAWKSCGFTSNGAEREFSLAIMRRV